MTALFMQSQAVAILNPRAGGGTAARRWPRIAEALKQRIGPVEARFTERPDHASELTRQALEQGADLIIAVGGDGTVNEVVNGFFVDDRAIRPQAKLGLIPFGTGGDLQRTLGIPSDIEKAADTLAAGMTQRVDVGKLRLTGHDGQPIDRLFLNLTSFGMGGDVSVRAKNILSPLSGKAAFLWATLIVFLRYGGKTVDLRLDGSAEAKQFDITNVALGNGRYHGGGMQPCPKARLDDGLLEVTVIERLSMFELLRDLPVLYSDDVYVHPKVRHFHAERVEATSEERVLVEVDGEALGRLPLQATLLKGALDLIVPA